MAKCEKSWWEWGYTDCKAKEKAGDAVGDILDGQMKEFAQSLSDMVAQVMKWFNTWWMDAPAPDLKADAVNQVISDLSWYTAAFAILGLLIALVRLVLTQDFKSLIGNALQPIANLIIVTACYATGLTLLLTAGDKFSTWILDRATTGVAGGSDLSTLVVLGPSLGIGGWIIFALLALLSSTVNVVFMFVRNVLMTVMMVFIPTLAAASGTETGKQSFNKANGYLLAFVLFKPVAAVIYALGLRFANSPLSSKPEGDSLLDDMGEAAITAMMGLAILTLAALALPALMKFLIPVAATGAGGFSGGAAIAGAATIGAGAAVIASTGGAGAGAAAAGKAGGGAGAGAAAAGQTGGESGTAGGANSAPGGGDSPAGGGMGSPDGGPDGQPASGQSAGGAGNEGNAPSGTADSDTQDNADSDSEGSTGSGADTNNAGGGNVDPGSGNGTVAASGSETPAAGAASGDGSGGGAGGRSTADTAAIAGTVSDAASAAGTGVEKSVEDE